MTDILFRLLAISLSAIILGQTVPRIDFALNAVRHLTRKGNSWAG